MKPPFAPAADELGEPLVPLLLPLLLQAASIAVHASPAAAIADALYLIRIIVLHFIFGIFRPMDVINFYRYSTMGLCRPHRFRVTTVLSNYLHDQL